MEARVTRAQTASTKAACVVCHRRKVRCDVDEVGSPCTNCSKVASRRGDCRIHEKTKRTSRKHKLMSIEALPPRTSPQAEHTSDFSSLYDAPFTPDASRNILYPDLEASSRDSEHLHKRHLVEFVEQPHIDQRPIDKNARVVYLGSPVANLHHLASQHFGQRTSRISHYPTDRLNKYQACHDPDRLPVDALELPPRGIVDQLLDAYFSHVNPGFPVVDEILFLAQYRARDPRNPPSLLLLHAILVVGAHILYAGDALKRAQSKAVYFRRAKALFDACFERNRDTIVQAALLLSWHTDGQEDVAANAWFWIGVAMRTATGLGMHRDADASTVVPYNKSMWRRVWWLLFQCDVLLALQYGRPRSIRLEDCDVKFLQTEDFKECGEHTQISYVTQTVHLAIIISRMLETRFGLTSSPYATASPQGRQQIVKELNDALARWSLELPGDLGSQSGQTLGLWPACLQLQYNTVLILLHRNPPWHQQTRDNADICAVAAGCIVSLLKTIGDSDGFKCLWISAVNSIFTALIQMDVQVRTYSPVLAVPALIHFDNTVALLRRFSDYWPNALPILHFFEHLRYPENPKAGWRRKKLDEQNEAVGAHDAIRQGPLQGRTGIGAGTGAGMGFDSPFNTISPELDMVIGNARDLNLGTSSVAQPTSLYNPMVPADTELQLISDIAEEWHEWINSRWANVDLVEEFPFVF